MRLHNLGILSGTNTSVLVPGTDTPNTLAQRFSHVINVLDFMPIGKYASILNNTNADSLTAYIQDAIDEAVTLTGTGLGSQLFFPRGWYLCTTSLIIPTMSTGYTENIGVMLQGSGGKSIITQNKRAASDVVDYSDMDLVAAQHALCIFGSNTLVRDMAFIGCVGGIYMGQDPNSGTGSEVSFNRLSCLDIKNCGTGVSKIVSVGPGQGTKYNTLENSHIAQCQIAAIWDEIDPVIANNNRNTVQNTRIARCNVGLWCRNGGTNDFFGLHFEGIHADVSATPYALPAGTPDGFSWACILGSDASDNDMVGCFFESNGDALGHGDVHNNGAQNRFVAGYIRPDYCNFVVRPLEFTSHPTLLILDQYTGLNTGAARTDALSGMAPGYLHEERPMITGTTPFGVPVTGLASNHIVSASASSNRQFTSHQYGATATGPEYAGAKTRGATADSVTVPNATDVLNRFRGWGADGVDRYRSGASITVQSRTTFSPTNTHSGINIKAVPSGSLTDADVALFDADDITFLQPLQFLEQTAPAAPPSNTVYIYAQDNGAGKTQLMARFATGAAQQVAIEP